MRLHRFFFALLFLLPLGALTLTLSSSIAYAQEAGQLTGIVTDSSGAGVPGVVVTATNSDTNAIRTATTSNTGAYIFVGLPPANYDVSTPATGGFSPYKAKVEVTVGAKMTMDIKLSVGSASTVVEVSTENTAQVNTTTQELSQVVDRDQLAQLP